MFFALDLSEYVFEITFVSDFDIVFRTFVFDDFRGIQRNKNVI